MSNIKSIVKKRIENQRLYNLAVQDDESYVANGIVVHNCKSRLVPNEKGAEKNPEIDRGGTAITQKALDAITLCESNYGLSFELLDRKTD